MGAGWIVRWDRGRSIRGAGMRSTTGIAAGIGGAGTASAGGGRTARWRGTRAGRVAITTEGDVVRGRLSGPSVTDAGPSSRAGVSRRPIPAVSESATTAPCAQESLMYSPDLADNNC